MPRWFAVFIVVTLATVTAVCAPLCFAARASAHAGCHGEGSRRHGGFEPEATDKVPRPEGPDGRAPVHASDCCCPTLGTPDKRTQPEIPIANAPILGVLSWRAPVAAHRLDALGSAANARQGPRLPLYLVECSLVI